MKQYFLTDRHGRNYVRVSKPTAKKLYLAGSTIYLSPSNLRPFTPFNEPYALTRKSREQYCADEIGVNNDFDNVLASFQYYNCVNNETGRRISFYKEVVK